MKNDNTDSRRRSFLKKSAAAGMAASIPAIAASAEVKAGRPAGRRLKVGAIGVGAFSFWDYTWGDILSPRGETINRGSLGTELLNMEIAYVWDRDPDTARKFAEKTGAKPVARFDGMVGRVDGVAFGGYYEVPWQHKLARPYIEAGMPVYLSRPFAYSLETIDEVLDLASKHGTPIMATDIYEHLYGVATIKKNAGRIGEIECVNSTCLTSDYPALFHTQFMIPKIFGYGISKVAVFTDNPNAAKYLSASYLFDGWEGQKPFLCHSTMTPRGDLYSLTVNGTEGIESSRLPVFAEWRDDLLVHHVPMLTAMQRTFEGNNFEDFDIVRKKTELFLTGFYSATERNGAPVDIGTVPPRWNAAPAQPDWIDEGIF